MDIKAAKQLSIYMPQSTREKGAMTKRMVLYETTQPGTAMRNAYVSQEELLKTFGRIPNSVVIIILDGDAQPEEGKPSP